MSAVFLALDALFKRYTSGIKLDTGQLPYAANPPPGDSECIQDSRPEDEGVFWKPIERKANGMFSEIEKALDCVFPEQLNDYYGSFWSDTIEVEHSSGLYFHLIQLWNEEDQERLKENMLGHLFAKRKNRLPFSYFIGCTDGNDVICLEHDSGQVVLEKPGFKAHQVLDERLDSFILQLRPVLSD